MTGQRSPAMAKVRGFLGPCILVLFALLIRSKIQKNITNLPKAPGDTDNYRFSNSNCVITAEDDVFVQLANRTNIKMAAGEMKCRIILWSLLLHVLCGDIMQNPGPSSPSTTKVRIHYKFPCGICKKPVKPNKKGVQCDGCDLWFHASCLSLSSADYEGLASATVWICSSCNHPNYSQSLTY